MNNNEVFRNLVIDLLDDPNGIDKDKFAALADFSNQNYPSVLADVFGAVITGGGRVWLDEGTAEELKTKK
jgi:hypothetical protein